jgi:hypothetical protein
MQKTIITKKEALERGFLKYYTGKPCARGHFSERFISGPCVACRKEKIAKAKEANIADVIKHYRYDEDAGEMFKINDDGSEIKIDTLNGNGYLVTHLNYATYFVHDLVFAIKGIDKNGLQCDHIDGNKVNNKFDNLRLVTCSENLRNKPLYKNNKYGVAGISRAGNRWMAVININGGTRLLGCFGSFMEAAVARKEAEAHYGYHKNHGRLSCA